METFHGGQELYCYIMKNRHDFDYKRVSWEHVLEVWVTGNGVAYQMLACRLHQRKENCRQV